jgi:hypothetical protein
MFTLDCQVRYFSLKTGAKLAKVILGQAKKVEKKKAKGGAPK